MYLSVAGNGLYFLNMYRRTLYTFLFFPVISSAKRKQDSTSTEQVLKFHVKFNVNSYLDDEAMLRGCSFGRVPSHGSQSEILNSHFQAWYFIIP